RPGRLHRADPGGARQRPDLGHCRCRHPLAAQDVRGARLMDLHAELTERAEASRDRSFIYEWETRMPHNPTSYEAGYALGRAHGLEEARDLVLRDRVDRATA